MPARLPHKKTLRKDIPASPSPPPHTTKSSKKAAIRAVSFWNGVPAARGEALGDDLPAQFDYPGYRESVIAIN
jgi:hypothetical protein